MGGRKWEEMQMMRKMGRILDIIRTIYKVFLDTILVQLLIVQRANGCKNPARASKRTQAS